MGKFIKIKRYIDLRGIRDEVGENTLIELVRAADIKKVFQEGASRTTVIIQIYNRDYNSHYSFEEKYPDEGLCLDRLDKLLKLLNEN